MPNQRIGSLAELRKAKTLEYFIQTESAERHMPLNWNEHQFLDHGEEYLQCVNHGALFTLTEGHCVYGPCLGEKLEAVSLETVGDDLFIRLV